MLPGWMVGPVTYHGEGERWHVVAIDLRSRGRQAIREAITVARATSIATLDALAALLVARQIRRR
jgi:lipoate-protein ligase B